jgi:hypothetical protein
MKAIGISESILLSELCYRRQYLARANKLTEDGFFYATVEDVEEETTLNDYAQRKALEKLTKMGLVKVDRRGLPAKRYIRIDESALMALVNATTDANTTVLKNLENKSLKNSGQINNNITNNNTHTLSLDNVFDKGQSQSSARPTTQTSGKLFSSEKVKTKKSSVQKTNNFITACHREAIKKEFSTTVLNALDRYFIMLAEMNCLLPAVSIAQQLNYLTKLSEDKQLLVINTTISRGWKSLQYQAEEVISSIVPTWDTASPDAFKAKTEEQKLQNIFEGVPEDNIF